MSTILIVEDEPKVSRTLVKGLSSFDHSVQCAIDGEEALSAIRGQKYDLIILDWNLPKLDGLTVLKKLRSEGMNTPVIMLSARKDVSDRVAGLNAGADDYLVKPFSFEELEARVNSLLRRGDDRLLSELARVRQLCLALEEENQELKTRMSERQSPLKRREAEGEATLDYGIALAAYVHDLKGELMNVASAAKSLGSMGTSTSEASEELDLIERSMQYSKGILQRILNMLEYGVGPVTIFNVGELLEGAKQLIGARLRDNVQLQIELSNEVSGQAIRAEKEQLTNILVELCTNAARAIGSRPGHIEIRASVQDKYLFLTVRDNGPGIPSDILPTMLHKQVPSTHGAGLGLYLSARVVESFGGEMRLVSSSNQGTEFCVALPRATKENS
jgi:DNA-binding response OmpR family regulator/anti-sigma regulatory factor (Ser/Thr protein kinase)